MRRIEAIWLKDRLEDISPENLSPVLEIGSSSLAFRTIHKPHIEEFVHAPLRERGVKIVTADIRDETGVDIVGDVFDADTQKRLLAVGARTLLMCNLFEHLTDPQSFADACRDVLVPGGRIIETVPHEYPYHLDPIDTMFRPDVAKLHDMFPGSEVESGEILVDEGYWSELRASCNTSAALARVSGDIARIVTLRGGFARARSRLSKLRFLFRPYKIAALVLTTSQDPIKN